MNPILCVRIACVLAPIIGAGIAHAETVKVTIEKLAYEPAEIHVKVGDTIEWINNDILAHTATVKGSWEVMIPPKATASRRMDNALDSDYFCRLHPNMKGHITVSPQ